MLFLVFAAGGLRANDPYIRGVHYYGFHPCSWPVNYLDTLPLHEVDSDLKTIAADGFNTIILLVPWGKCEANIDTPTPVYNDDTFGKLNAMIRAAASRKLDVVLRVPYTWALNPGQTHANSTRLVEALYDNRIRQRMLDFFGEVQQRLIQPNPNVKFALMSWEDFSGAFQPAPEAGARLLPDFRSYLAASHPHGELEAICGKTLDWKTLEIPAPKSPLRGLYLEWLDYKLLQLHAEALRKLPGLSLEVRVDSDPIIGKDDKPIWQNHWKTFDVPASGITTLYWAPFHGQINNGEKISAAAATESLNRMLSKVSEFTCNDLFIDQFNFSDNTAGFEKNAVIEPGAVGAFLASSASLLKEKTCGYALWTYRDYLQNMIYNATFQDGLEGWTPMGGTPAVGKDGVLLKSGEELSQEIPAWSVQAFGGGQSPEALLFIRSAESARVTVSQNGKTMGALDLKDATAAAGPGSIYSVNLQAGDAYTFGIRMVSGTIRLAGVAVSGHRQLGEVRSLTGKTLVAWEPLLKLNQDLATASGPGIVPGADIHSLLKGIYPDQWCGRRLEGKLAAPSEATKMELELWVPEWLEKDNALSVSIGSQLSQIKLTPGLNTVSVLVPKEVRGRKLRYLLQFSHSFIPRQRDPSSPDERELAAILKSVKFR